jgi:hypothetical protein
MKFFFDENFPRPALIQLQAAGHSDTHALKLFRRARRMKLCLTARKMNKPSL